MSELQLEVDRLTDPFNIVPEHLEDHDTLLTTSEYNPGDPRRNAESRTAVSLVINDIFACPYFDGSIIELRNSNRMIADLGRMMIVAGNPQARIGEILHALMRSAMLPSESPICRAEDEGRYRDVTFETGGDIHRPHLRDHFAFVRNHGGERVMLIPVQQAYRHEEERLYPLANRLGVRMAATMASFEGGNVLSDGTRNYTLSETQRDNEVVYHENAVRVLEANFGREGNGLIYLDGGELSEQPVYHLDLAVSFLPGPDGSTVALLSSLRMARQLLSENGVRGNIKLRDWFRQYVARQYQEDYAKERAALLTREISRKGSSVAETLETVRQMDQDTEVLDSFARRFVQENSMLPHLTHKAIGGALRVFLTRRNYDPVQSYLNRIGEGLAQQKIRVVEVPALILRDSSAGGFDRFSLSKEPGDSFTNARASNVPNYCPVNGVTYNGSRRIFFSSGGIIPFDRYIRCELGKLGYRYAPLPNAITMGWSQAGMHCGFVPFRQEKV